MEFVVRKVTESSNGGFIVTLDHETEVDTSIGKQRKFKSYSTKVLSDPPAKDDTVDVNLEEFDIVLREWSDPETGEMFRKNWLHPA